MRILVVNNFFPPRPGGSSHLTAHLAREYARAGHDVLVLTASYKGAPAEEIRDGYRVKRLPAWTLPPTRFAANFDIGFTMSPRVLREVFRIADEFDPDVVNQHGQFFDLTWLTGWWARRRAVPTLLAIHTRLESPLSRFNSFVYATADQLLVRPLMWLHKPVLVVMDKLMDEYVDRRYRGAHRGKVAIPVGIEPQTMGGGTAGTVRAELGIGDRPMMLSVGHVIPQRSRIALARALPRVLERFPDAVVVVVGGVYHDEFLHVAESLGVREAILAVGAQPQAAVPHYLADADLEVHELEGTGFGTASLEALAVGIPVVAAVAADNFLGIELRDGEDLYLVPELDGGAADPDGLAEVLIRVLGDPEAARQAVAENARRLIEEHFTLAAVASQYLVELARLSGARAERRSDST